MKIFLVCLEPLPPSRLDPSSEVIHLDFRAISTLSVQRYKFPAVKHLKLRYIFFPNEKLPLLPSLFPNFDKIISLDLSSTNTSSYGAKTLATILKSMTSLKSLNLGWNPLGRSGFEKLVPALKRLKNLENLYLPRIQVEEIHMPYVLTILTSLAQNLSLLELDLSFNDFRAANVTAALVNLLRHTPKLRGLNLGKCHLMDITSLVPEIRKMVHLKSLDLSQNSVGWKELSSLVTDQVFALEELDVAQCRLNATDLTPSFYFGKLKSFTFGNGAIGVEATANILSVLASVPGLDTLHLRHLNLDDLRPVGLEFQKFICPIKVLGLETLVSNQDIPDEFVAGLEHLSHSIEVLNLSRNRLGLEAAKFSKAFEKMVHLKQLSFTHNEIGPHGAKSLGKAFENLENLEELYFSGNQILDEGATALAQGLSKISKLKAIDLRLNSLTTEGLCAFFPVFEKNGESLVQLGLAHNHLIVRSLTAFKPIFRKLSKLQSLAISGNSFGDEEDLFSGFENLVSLKSLSVESAYLDEKAVKSLLTVTDLMPNLAFLAVDRNPFFIKYYEKPCPVLAPIFLKDIVVEPMYVSSNRAAYKVRLILSSVKLHPICPMRILPLELIKRVANCFVFDDYSFNYRTLSMTLN